MPTLLGGAEATSGTWREPGWVSGDCEGPRRAEPEKGVDSGGGETVRPEPASTEAPRWRGYAAMLAAVAFVLSDATAAAEPARCGVPGRPACPLQHWMRQRLAAPYAKADLKRLAQALDDLVRLNPKPRGWGNWKKFCADGAAAARAGKRAGAVEACTRCHKVYRRTYNFTHRERPLPTP